MTVTVPHVLEVGAVLLAAFIVGLTGFGFNVVAVPALALVMPAKDAVVITLVAGTLVNAALAVGTRGRHMRLVVALILISLPGMFLGTVIHTAVSESLVQLVVGAMTCLFALAVARRRPYGPVAHPGWLKAGAGAASGVLTTLTGMGGPPVVALLARLLAQPRDIRGSMAVYSAAVSAIGLATLVWAGAVERAMVHSGVLLAVPGFAGLALGSQVFRHRQRRYAELAAAILLLMGAATVVAAGWHMTS